MKRIVFGAILTLLLVCMLVLPFGVQPARSVEDEWWDRNWMFRRSVIITEMSGYSLTNFPVEVSFRHNGHVQSDGKDVRVIENDTELPYCITEINSTWITVMFQINITASSTKTIHIYYGNENAIAPNYPLVPLAIFEGQRKGNATIDNRIFIGWDYVAWGVQPGWYIIGWNLVYIDNNPVVLWNEFKMDFDNDGIFEETEDLITDFDMWKGGIGRYQKDMGNYVIRSYGLGDYQRFIRTPIYVELVFADATLRVYKGHNFVETTQADRLGMESSSWDYAKHQNGPEENIVDGLNTNGPPHDPTWNVLYNSSINPGWMAFRNSLTGYIFGAIGLNINPLYWYHFSAKESHAFDRCILFDANAENLLNPYDQPLNCRIYWYADGTNEYIEINKLATVLSNSPSITVLTEEIGPVFQLTITSTTGGTTNPAPGTYTYAEGTSVSVTAIPEENYVFSYWILDGIKAGSQNPIEILMTANHTLQAVFQQAFKLTITSTTGGTTNPPPGTYNYTAGTELNVTATPNIGYSFAYWLLDGQKRTENPITILMDANHTLEAHFVDDIKPEIGEPSQNPPPENVQPNQHVTVTVTVTDYGSGVKNVTLWYSIDNGTTWNPINMIELAANTFQATIPGYGNCTWITYKIIAYDDAGNMAVKDNNGYYYQYHVIPEFSFTPLILTMLTLTTLIAIIRKAKRKHIVF